REGQGVRSRAGTVGNEHGVAGIVGGRRIVGAVPDVHRRGGKQQEVGRGNRVRRHVDLIPVNAVGADGVGLRLAAAEDGQGRYEVGIRKGESQLPAQQRGV